MFVRIRRPPTSTRTYTLFPATTLFRSPLDVVREPVALAFLDVALLDRIGRHHGRRAQHQVEGLVKLPDPVVQPAARQLGGGDVLHGQGQALLDVPDDLRLELVAVAGQQTLARRRHAHRSEEDTSELQSLMRNSYAVFCLQKT